MQGRHLLLRLARLEAACDYHDGSQAHAQRSILVVAQREHLSRLSQHVGVCECQRRHLQSGLLDPIHTFGWLRDCTLWNTAFLPTTSQYATAPQ